MKPAKITRAQALGAAGSFVVLPHAAGAQTLERIRLLGNPTEEMTPVFYAIENGLYRKAGLDVEVTYSTSGSASIAAVISGDTDIGKSEPISVFLAHQHSLPLTIVANCAVWNSKNPFALLVTATDSPIKTAADCNGKTIAITSLQSLSRYAIMQWLEKNGGDVKTVKWIELPNSAGAAAVVEHRVDATVLIEPQLSAALGGGKVQALGDPFSAVANAWATTLYVANPAWATAHEDALRRWVRVTYAAGAYTNTHRVQAAPLISKITKIPIDALQKMAHVDSATSSAPALLQPTLDLAARYKVIPERFPARDLYFLQSS